MSLFSHRWRVKGLPGSLLLRQPLAESLWVFNHPVEIPQWTLPSQHKTQRVPFSLCRLHTFSTPFWRSIFSSEHSKVLSSCAPVAPTQCPPGRALTESSVILSLLYSQQSSFLCAPLYTRSMPTWQSYHRILGDSVFSFKLSTEFFFSTIGRMLDAHLAELHRTYNKVLSATVFSYTVLPPRYSATLRSSSRVEDSSPCAFARLCLTPQSPELHPLCTAIRTSTFCHTLLV